MSNSVQPQRRQPTRLPRHWDSPGKNTGMGCCFLLQCMKVKSLSCVRLLATPWTAAYQALPPMGFSRKEYWSRVPLPSPSKYATLLYLNVFTISKAVYKPSFWVSMEVSLQRQIDQIIDYRFNLTLVSILSLDVKGNTESSNLSIT